MTGPIISNKALKCASACHIRRFRLRERLAWIENPPLYLSWKPSLISRPEPGAWRVHREPLCPPRNSLRQPGGGRRDGGHRISSLADERPAPARPALPFACECVLSCVRSQFQSHGVGCRQLAPVARGSRGFFLMSQSNLFCRRRVPLFFPAGCDTQGEHHLIEVLRAPRAEPRLCGRF
jgi:hypothetical protein